MRDIDVTLANYLAGENLRTVRIVFLDFETDPTFVHDDVGTIRLDLGLPAPNNGMQDYIGVGSLGEISNIDEDAELVPDTYRLAINSVDTDLVAHARSLNHLAKEARIWIGALDQATGAIVGEPYEMIRGEMDVMDIQGGEESIISVDVTDERVLLDRATGILFSDAQQRTRYPGPAGPPDRSDGFFHDSGPSATRTIVLGPGSSPVSTTGGGGRFPRAPNDERIRA